MNFFKRKNIVFLLVFVVTAVLSLVFCFRIDLTSDKRYSISPQTKKLMKQIREPLDVTVYLTGDLNPGFFRLKRATTDLFAELSAYANKPVRVKYVNPSEPNFDINTLINKELVPINVYERAKDGKSVQKMIFPYAEISNGHRTLPVSLLKNIRGNSGEENLNISIENLEFEVTDAIRQLVNTQVNSIAFLEGHGELSEAETYDISHTLSRYFQVDRGILQTDASVLDAYKVVVVAGARTAFLESDKFILDQYLMHGGSILWLLDGVQLHDTDLTKTGISPAMALDVNLSDQFFRYGIRIEPVLLQDVQAVSVPVNIAPRGEQPQFEPMPFFFTPLLLTSPASSISRNINEIRAEFCSPISLVGKNDKVKISPLLVTSDNTHIVQTPSIVNLGAAINPQDKAYFNVSYLPVAFLLEGIFNSNFANRMLPKGLENVQYIEKQSIPTRQIFIASKSIIRNETNGIASDSTILPLGYDRFMNQQFGNKDFILNAVLYLADNEGWLQLRSRTLKLRLLNKNLTAQPLLWQCLNIGLPLLFLAIFGTVFLILRKKKYTKV